MKILKILPILLALLIIPCQSFAEMPEITAGQTYFDVLKGHYVLKDNVRVVMNNHGLKATVTANEARVNVVEQKCWALGDVNFSHVDYDLKCDNAYLQWQTKTADLVGGIDFKGKKSVSVTSNTATFNWEEKIADFYGDVKVTAEKDLLFDEGLKLEDGVNYAHVRYNVTEDKIIQLDKNFDIPNIEIPDPDK